MLQHLFRRVLSIVLVLGALWSLGSARLVLAAPSADIPLPLPNIIVNTTAIADDPNDGKCDLWEALQAVFQANYGLSPTYHECAAKPDAMNIIAFSVIGGTITLPTAPGTRTDLPFVHGNTVILGPITIAGNPAPADTHLLRTAPGATLTVIGVVLKNGHTSGAGPAIYSDNGASVNVIASFLINNTADNDGGAIYANGDLSLMGTSFINNVANGSPGRGGAVYMTGSGSFSSEASTYTANKANAGGAVYLEQSGGKSSINDSIFTANATTSDPSNNAGGAVFNQGGTLTIQRTAFNVNLGVQGNGGALVNNASATTIISDTLFNGNIVGDVGHARNGGAISNSGILSITKSTFLANVAVGGNGGSLANSSGAGSLTIANSTFSGNTADGQGGALYEVTNSIAAILNSTFSNNSATGGASAIYADNTTQVQIGNTILDRGIASQANCFNAGITSLGHNLDSDGSCGLNATGDQNGISPQLGGLAFNGGALPVLTTQKPNYGSTAIDLGDNAICADARVNNEDETGAKRPKSGNGVSSICDIGAVEVPAQAPAFSSAPMPPGPINFGSVMAGTALTTSFTISNAGTYQLGLSNPTLGDNAHFALSSVFPTNLAVNGQSAIVLSCTPAAAGSLQSTFSFQTTDTDKPSVSYTLLCNGTPATAPAFASLPVSSVPIEFGTVTSGQIATQQITVKNNGTASLTLSQVVFNSDASNFNHNLAPLTIGPGLSSQIMLTCQPNRVGALAGQLSFTTNDSSQASVSFNLNCNGVPPQSSYLVNTQNLKNPLLPSDFTALAGVATSPDGLNAYVMGGSSLGGQVVVLKKEDLGLFGESYLWTGGDSRSLLSGAHGVAVSPDGNYVLATAPSANTLVSYQRDSGTGALTYLTYAQNGVGGVAGMSYPWDLAFSPDSQFVYVTGYVDNSVAIFQRNAFGSFSFNSSIASTTMTTHTLAGPTGIVVSPDGKNVYVAAFTSSPATAGTLAVYRRNVVTGLLTPIQTRYQGDNQDNPGCFICFPLNGLQGPYQVTMNPDGSNLYVTSRYSNSIATFHRDPVTGLLQWNGSLIDNTGAQGLRDARGVAASPDGKHVYSLGYTDSALTMLNRDPATGYLTFGNVYKRDTISGVPALAGPSEVAVSSDGQFIFATASGDNAVSIFQVANPVPTLFNLQPASVGSGSADFTLIVKGAGFVNGAQVSWDTFHPTTTYFNSSELHATIPAAWLTAIGTHTIKVTNSTPGGGDSFNTLLFQITAPTSAPSGVSKPAVLGIPVPTIDHLNPGGVKAGDSGITVDVYGSNFDASGLTITANGGGAISSFIDSTHVRIVSFNVNTFAQPGTVNIQVNNNGVQSNIVGLKVAAPAKNPLPSIISLGPDWQFSHGAGSPQFIVLVTGSGFVDGTTAQWNGNDRPTKFINSTTVQATIFGSDLLWPGSNGITVRNVAPGGGTSNTVTFTVRPLFQVYLPLVRR